MLPVQYTSMVRTLLYMKLLLVPFLLYLDMVTNDALGQVKIQTKEVVYRGGIVRFSLPKNWIERYEPS